MGRIRARLRTMMFASIPPSESIQVGQIVNVADSARLADAKIDQRETVKGKFVFLPFETELSVAPAHTDTGGDRFRLDGDLPGWRRTLAGEARCRIHSHKTIANSRKSVRTLDMVCPPQWIPGILVSPMGILLPPRIASHQAFSDFV
jgi:hypothetical protein